MLHQISVHEALDLHARFKRRSTTTSPSSCWAYRASVVVSGGKANSKAQHRGGSSQQKLNCGVLIFLFFYFIDYSNRLNVERVFFFFFFEL